MVVLAAGAVSAGRRPVVPGSSSPEAVASPPRAIGVTSDVDGTVHRLPDGGEFYLSLQVGDPVFVGDCFRIDGSGGAVLELADGTQVTLGADTVLCIVGWTVHTAGPPDLRIRVRRGPVALWVPDRPDGRVTLLAEFSEGTTRGPSLTVRIRPDCFEVWTVTTGTADVYEYVNEHWYLIQPELPGAETTVPPSRPCDGFP